MRKRRSVASARQVEVAVKSPHLSSRATRPHPLLFLLAFFIFSSLTASLVALASLALALLPTLGGICSDILFFSPRCFPGLEPVLCLGRQRSPRRTWSKAAGRHLTLIFDPH